MNLSQIKKLTAMLDKSIWKDPVSSVKLMVSEYKKLGIKTDYRDAVKVLTRSGRQLTKEEKKKYGIHHAAKASTSIFDHFTEAGLPRYVNEAKLLSLAVSAIMSSSQKKADWKKRGVERIEFDPAPDCCETCQSLAGEYPVDMTPLPVLDTHLGCRCGIEPAEPSVSTANPEKQQRHRRDSNLPPMMRRYRDYLIIGGTIFLLFWIWKGIEYILSML